MSDCAHYGWTYYAWDLDESLMETERPGAGIAEPAEARCQGRGKGAVDYGLLEAYRRSCGQANRGEAGHEMNSKEDSVLRVYRTKAQAQRTYDRISRFYDYCAGLFEAKHRDRALARLSVTAGETVLEIGFGTGHCLQQMAESVGEEGKVYGLDISPGMLAVAKRRLQRAGLLERVELQCQDALQMPYQDNSFDAVFMSFTLELFDSPEIPRVLGEIKRVLKPRGRLGLVSMSKEDGDSLLLRLYEWVHKRFPQYADCRPIHVERSVRDAGFQVQYKEKVSLFRLPGEIVVGVRPS